MSIELAPDLTLVALDYHLGEVWFNGIRASDIGLYFERVTGLGTIEADRQRLQLLAMHGTRAVGRLGIQPRTITFEPSKDYLAKDREHLLGARERIFDVIVRPSIVYGDIPIQFDREPGEIPRIFRADMRRTEFSDRYMDDAELRHLFAVGLTFVCNDPLAHSPEVRETGLEFTTGARHQFDLGHLDSSLELRFSNVNPVVSPPAGWWTGVVIDVEDENSGNRFRFDTSLKNVYPGWDLVLNSRTYDVYLEQRATGVIDRAGVAKAVLSPLPFPALTRSDLDSRGAIVVNTGTGHEMTVAYTLNFFCA